jgi:hypothetical protein
MLSIINILQVMIEKIIERFYSIFNLYWREGFIFALEYIISSKEEMKKKMV